MTLRRMLCALAASARKPAATLTALALASALAPLAMAAELTITVENIRNDRGNIEISVYDSAAQWPDNPSEARHQVKPAAHGSIVFKYDLPPGTYAAAGYHDENANGKFDKDFMGVPKEGFIMSNNPHPSFSAPDFEDVSFTLPPTGAAITMRVSYPRY